jgi:uncharacterized protein DUF4389
MTVTSSYPVRVDARLDPHLSRWLWLVKWVLTIPHYIVLFFLWIAFTGVSVVAFFAILFTGRYPRPIFEFNVGVLRWTWRVNYYAYSVRRVAFEERPRRRLCLRQTPERLVGGPGLSQRQLAPVVGGELQAGSRFLVLREREQRSRRTAILRSRRRGGTPPRSGRTRLAAFRARPVGPLQVVVHRHIPRAVRGRRTRCRASSTGAPRSSRRGGAAFDELVGSRISPRSTVAASVAGGRYCGRD